MFNNSLAELAGAQNNCCALQGHPAPVPASSLQRHSIPIAQFEAHRHGQTWRAARRPRPAQCDRSERGVFRSFCQSRSVTMHASARASALWSLLLLVAAAGVCECQGPLPPYLVPSTFLPGQHPKKCRPGTTWVG